MPLHYFVNVARLVFIEVAGFKQSFEVAMKNRERRPQFVGDVGHEIAPDFVCLFQSRDIMEQRDYAARFPILIRDRNGGDLKLLFAIGRGYLCNPSLALTEP